MIVFAVNLRDELCEPYKQPGRFPRVIHPERIADARIRLIAAGQEAGAGIGRCIEQGDQACAFVR